VAVTFNSTDLDEADYLATLFIQSAPDLDLNVPKSRITVPVRLTVKGEGFECYLPLITR
jgi:hypothetical protein